MNLASIHVYPVKGLRGVDISASRVEMEGLQGDRRWMIVDSSGLFLSQRKIPKMATITASIEAGGLSLESESGGQIFVPAPSGAHVNPVTIWSDDVLALDAGEEPAEWLTKELGRDCRLVSMGSVTKRKLKTHLTGLVSFADGYPLLIISQPSLDWLNSHLVEPVPMSRFRTNIVVDGCEPFEEDTWETFEVGGVTFQSGPLCSRCSVTTVDQITGDPMGPEPLKTLAKLRRGEGGKVYFGVNLVPMSEGSITVGDPIRVISRRESPLSSPSS